MLLCFKSQYTYMALFWVVEHLYKLRVAIKINLLRLTTQILDVSLLPLIKQLIDIMLLFQKCFITNTMNQLQILNNWLSKKCSVTTVLLVCVRLTCHYEGQIHLIIDKFCDYWKEFRKCSLTVDLPGKLKDVEPVISLSRFWWLFEILISINLHYSMLGINIWKVQRLRFF